MITETFLNACFSVILNKTIKVKKSPVLYRDILAILDFYEKKEKLDISVSIKTKFECLKKICDLKVTNDKTNENILDSISFSEKYRPLHDFLETKVTEVITEQIVQDNVRQIRLRKKLNSLFSNYDSLSDFLEQLKDGSFESIDDLLLDYEAIIKTLYSNMMSENRGVAIEASSSLDLVEDDFGPVLDLIKKKYSRANTTSTGYSVLDNEVFNGGFEPSRIYIIGGSSGAGKSTLLNNFIVNSATRSSEVFEKVEITQPQKNGIKRVYIYITLENTIEESLLRTYQPMFNKSTKDVLKDIEDGVNIKEKILNELKKTDSTIVMKYFPSKSVSCLDLMEVLDEVASEYGRDTIKGLYVDYLDILKTDTRYDMYRIELGDITLSLKSLAVEYEIPVIVPTQLNKSAYDVQDSRELSVSQISESVKKVEHADCVMLLSKDKIDDTKVYAQIGKNRSGKANVNLEFKVNFSHFKFLSGNKVSNDKKPDSTTPHKEIKDFSGFGGGF